MHHIRVGMPLVRGMLAFQEGVHYNYTVCGHTLTMATMEPDQAEISAIQRGQALFALTRKENVIFILSRFGDLAWTASSYNWWINEPVMRPDPWSDMEQLRGGLTAGVCLVNASDGLVAALRTITFSTELSRLFMAMVQEQMKPPFDPWRYLEVVEETLGEHLDAKALVKDAACVCIANVASWQPFFGQSQATLH